jgi:lipopolysaccharide/colanic/teichoic acid biosynthesis glycosyltransferase
MERAEENTIAHDASPEVSRLRFAAKRGLDLIVATLALIVFSPVMAAVALAIRLDSAGPALFRQQRLGKDRKPFTIFKFRSMYVNSDDASHREAVRLFAEGKPTVGEDGTTSFKPVNDPRVTRVGKFIRATGLDELPQIFNVLRGEMSVVGPRPAIEYELDLYEDWYYRRFSVPPGITGLWQISRSKTTDLEDMVRQDVEYADSFSIWWDVKIILLTVPKIVLRGWSF